MISSSYEIGNLKINPAVPSGGDARPAAGTGTSTGLPQDKVTLSAESRQAAAQIGGIKEERDLGTEDKQSVRQLKKRDAEVKAHEQAHMAAGAGIVQGGASYQYQKGPDGRMYAVGGEVKIDVSPERTPEATIRKMQQVRAAALAPAQPSGTDRAVAAQAAQAESQARVERLADKRSSPSGPIDDRQAMPGDPATADSDARAVDTGGYGQPAAGPAVAGGRIDLSV